MVGGVEADAHVPAVLPVACVSCVGQEYGLGQLQCNGWIGGRCGVGGDGVGHESAPGAVQACFIAGAEKLCGPLIHERVAAAADVDGPGDPVGCVYVGVCIGVMYVGDHVRLGPFRGEVGAD